MNSNNKLKTIDLFAGAGGLSLGFLQTGRFQLVAAAEINKNARNTYKKNISNGTSTFEFIENVVGCDFKALSERLGGIEIVIGGPPCQGFSNANRQKNNLISMNNALVKEFFRAIKEIKPKAFVMENVNMLRSDTHRFYESSKDNQEIDALIEQGFQIPKRKDYLFISDGDYIGVDFGNPEQIDIKALLLPETLYQLISVLRKNLDNNKRLPKYLEKNKNAMICSIESFIDLRIDETNEAIIEVVNRLKSIKEALEQGRISEAKESIVYVVSLQKALLTMDEIRSNGLIGQYIYDNEKGLMFEVNSYSVIDYVNAILGDEYIQDGGTVCSEWFGVPQERRRYIVIGVRRDCINGEKIVLPQEPENYQVYTVWDAFGDLMEYEAEYESEYTPVPYSDEAVGEYAAKMRSGSTTVKNHITTKTTEEALKRFKAIPQGKNFHSLSVELKSTYSKPERTQNTIYLRLDETKPSGTVVNVRKSMWIHPRLHRAITVREAARLQSFPDSFEFVGTKDSQYQQVGNAVPPLLAKAIAEKVLENIE